MAIPSRWLTDGDGACWQCGRPATRDSAYAMFLVAAADAHLDGLGAPVQRGRREDKVRLRIPRCEACRFRGWLGVATVLAGALVGGIAGPILQATIWPPWQGPAWLQIDHEGPLSNAAAFGMVAGFVIALLGVAVSRKRAGLRSLNNYPAVLTLRQEGWRFPAD
jgi:hypothetical protein